MTGYPQIDDIDPKHNELFGQWATEQIRTVLGKAPLLCLSFLERSTPQTLANELAAMLDDAAMSDTGPGAELLATLGPWADYCQLADWMTREIAQLTDGAVIELRQLVATAYMDHCLAMNAAPVFVHQQTSLPLSVEVIGLAIANHIEGALLEHYGSQHGPRCVVSFIGHMLAADCRGLSPSGVEIMDGLFMSLVDEYRQHGLFAVNVRH